MIDASKRIFGLILILGLSVPVLGLDMTPIQVREQIKLQLTEDPLVPEKRIKVLFKNKIAQLNGEVSNLMAKNRATELTLLVRGVDSVVNNIKVLPTHQKRKTIEANLNKVFRKEKSKDLQSIKGQVADDGQAFLVGKVDTFQERNMAESIALTVSGVTGVTNAIEVTSDPKREPAEMLKEIRSNIYWNPYLEPRTLSLQVIGNQAILTGQVGSLFAKQQAIKAAHVAGIHNVNSLGLRIKPSTKSWRTRRPAQALPTDAQIASAVSKALMLDPLVLSSNVNVNVDKAIVTLTGQVESTRARQAAYRDAMNTYGVVEVHNDLRIASSATMARTFQ